jgi:hypothetical protein
VRVELAAPDDIEDLLSMLRAGMVELAVTELPTATQGLLVHRLDAQDLVVVLPPGTETPPVMTLRALASRPLIVTSPGTSSRRVLDDALSRAGVEADVAVLTAQREALVPLVLAGAGAALLPRAVAATAAAMGAVVAETSPVLTRPIGLLHRQSMLSPLAAAFWTGATGSPPPQP